MNIAYKNIKRIETVIDSKIREGMRYMSTLVTSNHGVNCYAFTELSVVKKQVQAGYINLNKRGVWDTKKNALNFSDSIGNIHDLYALTRKDEVKIVRKKTTIDYYIERNKVVCEMQVKYGLSEKQFTVIFTSYQSIERWDVILNCYSKNRFFDQIFHEFKMNSFFNARGK